MTPSGIEMGSSELCASATKTTVPPFRNNVLIKTHLPNVLDVCVDSYELFEAINEPAPGGQIDSR